MSNNIYDILGKLDGLTPKANPVSTAEPIYENIDPRGDITEAVKILEEKYKKSKNQNKEKDFKYQTNLPSVRNFLNRAYQEFPNSINDTEATLAMIAKDKQEEDRINAEQNQWMEKAKSKIDSQQTKMNDMAQVIIDQEKRFQEFNKQVAAANLPIQQKAQAAADFSQDTTQEPSTVISKYQDVAEPAAPTNVVPLPTKAPAPVQVVAPVRNKSKAKSAELTNQPEPNAGAGLQFASPGLNPNYPVDTTADAANTDPLSQFFGRTNTKKVANMRETQLEEMDTGVSGSTGIQNAQKIANFLSAHQKYKEALENPQPGYTPQQPPVSVVLQFTSPDGRQNVVNLSKSTVDKLINSLKRPGTTNQERSDFTNIILADADKLRDYMNNLSTPRPVRKVVSVNKGQDIPHMDQDKFSGNKKLPQGSRETKLSESLGKNTMTKPTSIIEAVRSVEDKKLKEAAKPDFLDLDKDGDTDEPMKSAAKSAKKHEPAEVDKDAVAKRKRLQALKDKQEDERAEKGDDYKSASRFVKGRAYGGAAQKDDEEKDLDESGLQAYLGKKKYGKEGMKALQKAGRDGAGKEKMASIRARHDKFDESAKPDYIDLDKDGNKTEPMKKAAKDAKKVAEVAPPGAKAERMVKGIKKSLSKDGHLSGKDKAIAYATTWKARNKGQVEEATEFGDKVKNSKAELKKHKMVKEGRNAESSEYTYETIGRVLCDEQPDLDANSEAFVKAVYDELIEMKLTPKAARWLVHYDEDFLSDAATSYGHFCASKEKEAMECGAPINSFVSEEPLLDAQQELDEIAKLAGLAPKMEAKCSSCGCADCECNENLDAMTPSDSASPLTYAGCSKCNADPCCCEDAKAMDEGMGCSEEELNEAATRKDFRMVADLLKSIPDIAKRTELAMYHADIFKQQNSRFKKEMFLAAAGVDTTPIKDAKDEVLVSEEEMGEGNEFSGALSAAKAAGEKEFEVDGKKYTVKEDININVSANGEEDVVNLIRKLSGMPVVAIQAQPAMAEEVVAEEGPMERDVEYTNTPREQVAGVDAAIPAGADLNRAKRQFKKEYPGDNPMAVKEAIQNMLWNDYQSMINDVKA